MKRAGLLFIILLFAVGCGSINEDLLAGSKDYQDYVKPMLSRYIDSDPSLDDEDKEIRKRPIKEYDLLLKIAEED